MLIDGHYGVSATFDPLTMAKDSGNGRVGGDGAYVKPSDAMVGHEGAAYLVCGSSAQVSTAPLTHPIMVSNALEYGSIVLDLEGPQLDVRFLTRDGIVLDRLTIVKGRSTPIPRHHDLVAWQSAGWKMHDAGVDLHALPWTALGYADQSWTPGQGLFGYNNAGGAIIFTTPIAQNLPTNYFRRTFELPVDPANVEALRLSVNFDDGFVAYLNGTEVARRFMPAGPIGFSTLALNHAGGLYESIDISSFANALVAGTNILAVELHQVTMTATDAVFDAALSAESFVPFLGAAAAGTIGSSLGQHIEPFTIQGSTGAPARSVDAELFEPITFAMAQPPTNPAPANFAIFGRIGTPAPAETMSFGSAGDFCFTPSLLNPADPGLFLLSDNFSYHPSALVASAPGAWSYTVPGGLGFAFEVTFQGFMLDTPSTVRSTNGIRLNVRP
jgi:hypothetical protein